jgi:hopene-associated glycosyltransferase HpnB
VGGLEMIVGPVIAAVALAIWLYLIVGRGAFWRASVSDLTAHEAEPRFSPCVVAIVPARNEADVIAESLRSLFTQDYPGPFSVVLVDDQSRDGTAALAAKAAMDIDAQHRLMSVTGRALPAGWSGKVWAMKQGVDHADGLRETPHYLLFTDADIAYAPDTLRRLVARAEAGGLVLTSLMAKLRCESFAERALIPAFVFFFQMLCPFAWVNNRNYETAAAAGGCMLVRRDALREAGGIEAISNALIDDCALGKRLKSIGPVWLGLTERVRSLRPYPHVADIRRMVSRSAYDQLRYSPVLLAATIAGMALIYWVPPAFALFGTGLSQAVGALAWAAMALAFQPMLRFYRVSPWWGAALPAIAGAYMVFTLDSAYQHLRGRGGLWKGRIQANASGTR